MVLIMNKVLVVIIVITYFLLLLLASTLPGHEPSSAKEPTPPEPEGPIQDKSARERVG